MVKGGHTLAAWLGMYCALVYGWVSFYYVHQTRLTYLQAYLLAAVKGHTKSDIEPATSTNGIILLDKRVWWVVAGTMPTASFYLPPYVEFQDCTNCIRIFFIKLRGKQGSLNLASQVQVGGII